MQTLTIVYIVLAFIVALSLALFQYVYQAKKTNKLAFFLASLRCISLMAVALLLINPKFDKTTLYNEKPNLIVAVDNSESVRFLNQDQKANNLVTGLRSHQALNNHFNVHYYSFGKEVSASSNFTFNEKQTNPSVLFDRLTQVYRNSTAPLLILSDGNQTYGKDYEFVTNVYKQPIFPIILGDTTRYLDLKIDQLNVNKYAYYNNKFPVEIIAVFNGTENVTTQLNITSGNRTFISQNLTFSQEQTSRVITLTLPADRSGVHVYSAELKPLSNEKNIVNNSKNFAVEVIDRKANIAIISDMIHPDLGALKKAIESNEQREATLLKPSDFEKLSNDFQQVILYQPNQKFKSVYDVIDKLNINAFTILGVKTNWTELNNLQQDYQQPITGQSEDYQPTLNLNYNAFIVDDLNFSDFPPLQSEFGATVFAMPTEPILYKTIHGTQLKEPLLLTYEVNQKRGAVLNGEGIWRWRSHVYLNEKSFLSFDNFIGKIFQYLDSNQTRNRLNVSYESFYEGTDDVRITAQFFNKNYEFDNAANLEITLTDIKTKNSRTIPFILTQNNYQVDLSGIEAGDYQFTVKVTNESLTKSGAFKVLEYNVEQQFLNANVSKLKNLAASSSGAAYFIDDTSMLIDTLLKDERFGIIQKSTKNVVPLIDWKFLLALIVLSLSLEWFIRKYNGLI